MNPKEDRPKEDENPFENMEIGNWEILDTVKKRSLCLICNKSRKYFCYSCYIPVAELEGKIPRVKLPIKIDIIKHAGEIDGKSTAAHAAVLAPDDVKIFTYPSIPEYEPEERVILIYPGKLTTTVADLFTAEREASGRDSRQVLPITRAVFIDSTWNQSKGIYKDPRLRALPCVVLGSRLSQFWRHQKGSPRWYLATVEAVHQLLVEVHNNAGTSLCDIDSVPQRTLSINSLPRQKLNIDSLPRQKLDIDSIPRQKLDIDSVPRQKLNIDSVPQQTLDNDSVPRQKLNIDSVPQQKLNIDSVPQQTLDNDIVPRQKLNIDSVPRQKIDIESLTRQKLDIDSVPRQKIDIESLARQKLDIDSVPRQTLDINSVPQQTLDIESVSRQCEALSVDETETRVGLYTGQYDALLFFFRYMYSKIHTLYGHESLLSYQRRIK